MIRFLLAGFLALAPVAARAQTSAAIYCQTGVKSNGAPILGLCSVASTGTIAGATVGAASAQALAAGLAHTHVLVQNTSASATIACSWGGTAVLNSSGSFSLGAGASLSWGLAQGWVPTAALNCIASAGSTPLYIEYN